MLRCTPTAIAACDLSSPCRTRGRGFYRARAIDLTARLAQAERDAILSWPAQVVSEMATRLGVDPHQLQTLLDTGLRQHLLERGGPMVQVD